MAKSGYFYNNKFTRMALEAYAGVMGENELSSTLDLAGLSNLIDNYPPENLERQFDFADYTAMQIGLELRFGPRGGRSMALRAGRATFNESFKDYGALTGMRDPSFQALPPQIKIKICLSAAAKIFSQMTDQTTTVEETESAFIWTTHRCPICWARTNSDKPICYFTTGFLQAMLAWVSSGAQIRVNESKCCAMGDHVCDFIIQKEPIE